jgi:hypothetical protein
MVSFVCSVRIGDLTISEHWDRLLGKKRPLLIFSGTLSGKTKEKRMIKMRGNLIQMHHAK